MFDFDNDGELDPFEVAIGASLIGSIGYGAGLSEAEEKEYRLRDEYDEELKRKQERIDELEDELDELRSSRDDDDYYSDYDDDVEISDNYDDDIYDFVRDYGGTEFLATSASSQDLEYLQCFKDHLEDDSLAYLMTDGDCTECAFWVPSEEHHSRGWCCQIWSWIQIQYGGALEDENPERDRKVCPKYQRGTGVTVTCYDCEHWDQSDLVAKRKIGCKHWKELSSEINDLRRNLKYAYGSIVQYDSFSSEWPYKDEEVCFDFQLDRNLGIGYGKQRVKIAKESAE